MKNFKAILFDFDGVLADTINDLCASWQRAFKNYGIEIESEDYCLLEGMKLVEIARTISRRYGREFNDEECLEIKKLKDKYYLEDCSFKFYPEVPELVNLLKKKDKKLAIVSASPKEKLEKTVSKDFLDKFDVIVSGDDAEKGKPNPEPYLIAMKKLNIDSKDCVVIENAPLGIRAAKNAGIYCVALTTTLDRKYLIKAEKIVRNHRELKELLI